MGRLVIVSRQQVGFLQAAAVMFAGEPGVEVIVDRRAGGRRRNGRGRPALDERTRERRRHAEVDARIRQTGFAVVSR